MPLHPNHWRPRVALVASLALLTTLATVGSPGVIGQAMPHPSSATRLAQVSNPASEALLTLSQAEQHLDNGRYPEAIPLFQEAIRRYEALKDEERVETARDGMAKAYLLGGQPEVAISLFEAQIARQQARNDGRVSVSLLHNTGFAYFQVKRYAEAERILRAAIGGWERSRQGEDALVREDNTLITLFEQQIYTYRLLQKALVAQNKTNEALEVAEQSRARALVELLIQRQGEKQFPSPNLEKIQQIARSRNATLVEYSIVGRESRVLGDERDEETDLFIWVIQPSGEVTFRQVKLPTTHAMPLSELVLKTREEGLGVRGAARRKQTTPSATDSAANPELRQLYQVLIAPISDRLPTDPEAPVVIIPQGSLYLVPFAALQDPKGTYLIQKHTLLTASSAQVMELTRRTRELRQRNRSNVSALVVGNPAMPSVSLERGEPPEPLAELPGAEKEARAIAPLLNTQPLIGSQATKTAVVQALPQQRIIHLATHGLLDLDANLNEFGMPLNAEVPTARQLGVRVTPGTILVGGNVTVNGRPAAEVFAREKIVRVDMPGAIALAPSPGSNGFLTAKEIAEMRLTADMVVLSACDTGRGRVTGEGIVGLSRSFIAAGVPSVIVSLWAVPDAPTASLMTEFYQNLQRKPDKAWALRQATLTTLKQFPEPKDWGAFVLIGES